MRDEFNNKLNADGFNNNGREFSTPPNEWESPKENQPILTNNPPKEFPDAPKGKSKGQSKKNKTLITRLLSCAAATVVTVSAGTAILPSKTQSEILECYATDRSIGYMIYADESEHDLVLTVENDNTKRIIDLKHGDNVGDVLNLKSNMLYTLKIKQKDGRATTTKDVTIRTQPQSLESVFYGIEYTPADNPQGEFKFIPRYSDPNDRWAELYVRVLDKSEYGFESVITASDKEYSVKLTENFICSSSAYLEVCGYTESGEEEYLYGMDVSILKNRTEWLGIEYSFDADKPNIITFIPEYVDENGLWKNLTASLYDSNIGEIATIPITGSLETHELEFLPTDNSGDTYLEIFAELNFGDYKESVYLYSEFIERN